MSETVIVCVDEDPAVHQCLSKDLAGRIRECRVLFARDGLRALDLLQEIVEENARIAVLICAHSLPDMGSHELIRCMQERMPDLQAIMLADDRPAMPVFQYARIFRTILKPWTLEDFLFTVGEALDSYHRRQELEAQSAARRESDQRLRAFVERAPDGILTIDQNGVIQSANPAVERLFGYPLQEVVGRNISLLMPKVEALRHDHHIAQYIAGGPKIAVDATREVLGQRQDGSEIPLEVSVSEFLIGDRRFFSGILRDISERRRAQQLAKEKEMAEHRAAAKSAFLATMSHEIRTPMNGVLGMLELLSATQLSTEQMNLLGICRDSAQHLLTIIDDILDFSKIEAGKLRFETAEAALDGVAFSVAELMASRAWAKDLELVTFVDNEIPALVLCDQARLRQILINLVGNSIKFTPSGQVAISLSLVSKAESRCRVRFEVTDTGIGMSDEEMGRLFCPFEQADVSTNRRFGGSGLGLAISRRLVEMMSGDIGVTSEVGQGSTFWFEVPFTVVRAAEPPLNLAPSRILLVAVNPIFRDVMERGLSAAGARVDTIDRFADAPVLVQVVADRDPYHLVIVEDGCAVAHGAFSGETLTHPDLGTVPVLLLARRDRGPISTLLEITKAQYGLSRPARPGLMVKTVAVAMGMAPRSILDEGQNARDAALSVGGAGLPFTGGRVLIAEDTPTSRLVVTKMLQRMGIEPTVTDDGAQAWDAILRSDPFDILITDCHMPEMDGFQLTEKIRLWERERGDGQRLPIVALSAGVLLEEKARCLGIGMDGFLAKPVDSDKLRRTLMDWLPKDCLPRVVARGVELAENNHLEKSEKNGASSRLELSVEVTVPDKAEDKAIAQEEVRLSPVLDLAIYYELFGEINDDVRALLAEFLRSADELIVNISAQREAGEAEALAKSTHRLAGAALSAGAMELGEMCRSVENSIKTHCPWEQTLSVAQKINDALDRTRDAIRAV